MPLPERFTAPVPAPSKALLPTHPLLSVSAGRWHKPVFIGFLVVWLANALAALTFLSIHLPGWYFMASLKWTQPVAMLSIVAIGLVAGYARIRSGSTWASIAVHFVNNAYSIFLR